MNKKAFSLISLGLICSCLCDVSLNNGERPSPASQALPGEYGAPPIPTPSSVQVSEENVQFAGQVVEFNRPAQQPNNAYLPPNSQYQLEQLKQSKVAQALPKKQPPKPFKAQLNTGEIYVIPSQSAQLNQPIFVQSGRLQAQPQFNRPQQSIFQYNQQLPQFQQIRQFNPQSQFQFQQQQQQPYAPPTQNYPYPPATQNYPYPPRQPPAVHETVDEKEPEQTDADEGNSTDTPVIAVSNASGQYYILSKDNTLQRVVYETTQTEDDVINSGFTAQLRYSPVAPIIDPVYGYDDQGHLIRIYNKK